jgi:curli biogenesis system outer membrane secretion channel CsgG
MRARSRRPYAQGLREHHGIVGLLVTSVLYMRRIFVICLILLLPLNMFALAMAASAMLSAEAAHSVIATEPLVHSTAVPVFADSYLPDNFNCQTSCDIDPDEPPAGADVHDFVNEEVGLRFADVTDDSVASSAASYPSHSRAPLLKPPRVV